MIALLRDHMGPEIRKQVSNLFFASAELFDYARGTTEKNSASQVIVHDYIQELSTDSSFIFSSSNVI
jgi:hypothetical protein